MHSKSFNSEDLASRNVYKIRLKNNNSRTVIFQFTDSSPVDSIDYTIRAIFHIERNQSYTVSYAEEDTGENVYIITSGRQFSQCIMMGIEMLNVNIRPSESQLSSASRVSKHQIIKNNKTSNQQQSEPMQNIDDRIMDCRSRCDASDKNSSRECLLETRPSWLSLFNEATVRVRHWFTKTDTKDHSTHPKSD